MELRGFEPLTSSMPWKRATNCAIAPRCAYRPVSGPERPVDTTVSPPSGEIEPTTWTAAAQAAFEEPEERFCHHW